MNSNLKENINYFKDSETNWNCTKGWILLGNWAEKKDFLNKKDSAKQIKSYFSIVPPDLRVWKNNVERHHKPIINFCT